MEDFMSLEVNLAGITFPNPFILASGPQTANGSMIKAGFDAGWGGAVIKTVASEPTPMPRPRVQVLGRGSAARGMVNLELFTDMPMERWKSELDLLRDAYPSRPVIVSIIGGGRPDEWQESMQCLEPHGVTAYELNVSCPNISGKKGAQLGQDAESVGRVVKWAKEGTHLPVFVKLTPNVSDIVAVARAAWEAGADALVATNTLSALAGIDLESFTPLPDVSGFGMLGGYSGPGLKPVSLRCVANIARALPAPIFGCGGISTWQDALEYSAVGASLFQVCTAVMWHGYGIINQLTRGVEEYLGSHGFSSLEDIRCKALPKLLTDYFQLDMTTRRVAIIDKNICNGCGICVKACDSGGYQAIRMEKKKAVVIQARCDGCGLCVGVCPVEAISLE
jgi:dihydropyrimidine dehydrogenase (NAD+) subunit PreA